MKTHNITFSSEFLSQFSGSSEDLEDKQLKLAHMLPDLDNAASSITYNSTGYDKVLEIKL